MDAVVTIFFDYEHCFAEHEEFRCVPQSRMLTWHPA
jgi:hypothetical protein